jgi:chromosome segregation ATPase
MHWQDILSIVIPIGALLAWVYNRIDKKFDQLRTDVRNDINDLRKDVQSIETRVSRIEGQLTHFEPRWEPRWETKASGEKK